MVPIQGISKLPVSIKQSDAIPILMELATVSEKIGRLDEKFKKSLLKNNFINTLATKESVYSTRIEGMQVTLADVIEQSHQTRPKWEHIEVNNYKWALTIGTERMIDGYPLTTGWVLGLHTILMNHIRDKSVMRSQFRRVQNFIGSTNQIEDAIYIPVAANEIDEYMQNWELYINQPPYREKLDIGHLDQNDFILDENCQPLLRVAILHAQFESIHPFLDGNGRLGRILIVALMIKLRLISNSFFFVSEQLEKRRAEYYHHLNGVRGMNPDWSGWLKFFINVCDRTADQLLTILDDVEKLALRGMLKCRRDIVKRVYFYTFREPNTTAIKVSKYFAIARSTARGILNELVELELLFKDTSKKRNIEYYNYDILELLN